MSWIIISLLTPLFFTFTNFIEKFLIEKRIKDPISIVVLSGLAYFLIGLLIILLHGFILLPVMQALVLFLSGILLVLYLIPYFKALSLDDASRVVPLFQFVPVFVLVLSAVFLQEYLSGKQLLAFFIVLSGGFLLGAEKAGASFLKPRLSFWYMMLSSFLYAFIGILFKYALVQDNFWVTITYQAIGTGIGAMLLLCYPRFRTIFIHEVRVMKNDVWLILGINKLFEFLADLSYAFAVTLAPVALVNVIGSAQTGFLFLGGLILSLWFPTIVKEDIRRKTIVLKFASMALITIGIFLLSF